MSCTSRSALDNVIYTIDLIRKQINFKAPHTTEVAYTSLCEEMNITFLSNIAKSIFTDHNVSVNLTKTKYPQAKKKQKKTLFKMKN